MNAKISNKFKPTITKRIKVYIKNFWVVALLLALIVTAFAATIHGFLLAFNAHILLFLALFIPMFTVLSTVSGVVYWTTGVNVFIEIMKAIQ